MIGEVRLPRKWCAYDLSSPLQLINEHRLVTWSTPSKYTSPIFLDTSENYPRNVFPFLAGIYYFFSSFCGIFGKNKRQMGPT